MNFLHYSEKNEIGILRISRKEALNALNSVLITEMETLIKEIIRTNSCHVLIFTGDGDKAFISGADIEELLSFTSKDMLTFCEKAQNLANLIEKSPLITIAAINGYALGAGLEIAMACDVLYASQNAILGLPEIHLGLIPGAGGTQRLTRAIGLYRAKESILTGKTFSAMEAKQLGLINEVFPQEDLLKMSINLAKQMLKHSTLALKSAKQAIDNEFLCDPVSALLIERSLCAKCIETDEAKKALNEFLQRKSKPR